MAARSIGFWLAWAALSGLAAASAQDASQLAGTWKRTKVAGQGEPSLYRLTAEGSKLTGQLLNAPEDGACSVELTLDGKQLTGTARWHDESTKEDLSVRWELTVAGPDKLTGRCEFKVWAFYDDGRVEVDESGWEDYVFERGKRVGLVTEGEAEEAPFGSPVEDPSQLEGGWMGPGGAWALSRVPGGPWIDLTPVGHTLAQRIRVKDERGILKGGATLDGNEGCLVELAYDDGVLTGRSSWQEQGGEGNKGWSPLKLTRLPRIDAGSEPAPDAPAAGEGGSPGPLSVWKRDDGLYLRLKEGPGGLEGDLVEKDGTLKARVSLQAKGGVWVGRANWDGAEANWELSRQGSELVGRCEWIDVHDGRVVARGWSARGFKQLRRVM